MPLQVGAGEIYYLKEPVSVVGEGSQSSAGLTIITEVPRSSKMPQTWANEPQRTSFLGFLEIADRLTSSVYKSLITCLEGHILLNANFT